MNGQYSEKLPTGGELVVTATSWQISYYFPGPDSRYNGTFVTINGYEIDNYIRAWRSNFDRYLMIKQSFPYGGQFDVIGDMGMSIRIGWNEGVCLKSYHMPINSYERLEQVIADYEFAKMRAARLQWVLREL